MRVRNKLMWWCGALVGSEECGWWREERGLGAVERCGGCGMRVEGVRYLWKACGGRVVGFEKGVLERGLERGKVLGFDGEWLEDCFCLGVSLWFEALGRLHVLPGMM